MNNVRKRNRLIRRLFPDGDDGYFASPQWEQDAKVLDPINRGELQKAMDAAGVPLEKQDRWVYRPLEFAGLDVAGIVAKCAAWPDAAPRPDPTLGVLEFFDGNGDETSIAANRDPSTSPLSLFRETLSALAARPDVAEVRLIIGDCPNPEARADRDQWLHSDTAVVQTAAGVEDVAGWVASLRPDEVFEREADHAGALGLARRPGHRIVRVWWD